MKIPDTALVAIRCETCRSALGFADLPEETGLGFVLTTSHPWDADATARDAAIRSTLTSPELRHGAQRHEVRHRYFLNPPAGMVPPPVPIPATGRCRDHGERPIALDTVLADCVEAVRVGKRRTLPV